MISFSSTKPKRDCYYVKEHYMYLFHWITTICLMYQLWAKKRQKECRPLDGISQVEPSTSAALLTELASLAPHSATRWLLAYYHLSSALPSIVCVSLFTCNYLTVTGCVNLLLIGVCINVHCPPLHAFTIDESCASWASTSAHCQIVDSDNTFPLFHCSDHCLKSASGFKSKRVSAGHQTGRSPNKGPRQRLLRKEKQNKIATRWEEDKLMHSWAISSWRERRLPRKRQQPLTLDEHRGAPKSH